MRRGYILGLGGDARQKQSIDAQLKHFMQLPNAPLKHLPVRPGNIPASRMMRSWCEKLFHERNAPPHGMYRSRIIYCFRRDTK
jgi:hypothetical protein